MDPRETAQAVEEVRRNLREAAGRVDLANLAAIVRASGMPERAWEPMTHVERAFGLARFACLDFPRLLEEAAAEHERARPPAPTPDERRLL